MKQELARSLHSICPLFESWGKIVPLFRASRLLSRSERESLIAEINNFASVAKIANISITMKMHHLIHHAQHIALEAYNAIGYFAEDALESIHALVIKYCNRFSQMDGDRQGKQVLCSLQLDKQDKHATANKMVKEEKKRLKIRELSKGTAQNHEKKSIMRSLKYYHY